MDYIGEDNEYYNNYNNYDLNDYQHVFYDPIKYSSERHVYPPRNYDLYQCNGVTYSNENYFDLRGDQEIEQQPYDMRGYNNFSEDEFVNSDFMTHRGNRKNKNPTLMSNRYIVGSNIGLQNEDNGKRTYRSSSSRRNNRSSSVHSSVNPKNNGLIIHINGQKLQKNDRSLSSVNGREDSVRSYVPLSINSDRMNEDTRSYINSQEEEEEYSSPGYHHVEMGEDGRTTIININCNNIKNSDNIDDSDIYSEDDDDDDDEEDEDDINNKIPAKPIKPSKPKKIFMGKYLFSDIKKSLFYPLTVCGPHPTLLAPNPSCFHYKITPKSRGEKHRKPEIVVRY